MTRLSASLCLDAANMGDFHHAQRVRGPMDHDLKNVVDEWLMMKLIDTDGQTSPQKTTFNPCSFIQFASGVHIRPTPIVKHSPTTTKKKEL